MRGRSILEWAQLAFGLACVGMAVVLAAIHVPDAVESIDSTRHAFAYVQDPTTRLITSGDMLDLTADMQHEALALIPPRATYAVLLPSDPDVAASQYGIGQITYGVTAPWLRYLLLPAKEEPSLDGVGYVICWGCDRSAWDPRVRWLWQGDRGQAIGRVVR